MKPPLSQASKNVKFFFFTFLSIKSENRSGGLVQVGGGGGGERV